jgi:hypothetical protein
MSHLCARTEAGPLSAPGLDGAWRLLSLACLTERCFTCTSEDLATEEGRPPMESQGSQITAKASFKKQRYLAGIIAYADRRAKKPDASGPELLHRQIRFRAGSRSLLQPVHCELGQEYRHHTDPTHLTRNQDASIMPFRVEKPRLARKAITQSCLGEVVKLYKVMDPV